jgi:hypothetical protein
LILSSVLDQPIASVTALEKLEVLSLHTLIWKEKRNSVA